MKDCMVETAGILCPGSKSQFEKISLSRRTITRRVEVIAKELLSELKKKKQTASVFFLSHLMKVLTSQTLLNF